MGFLQAAQQKHLSCHCFPLYSIFFIPEYYQLFNLPSILVIRSLWSLTCSEYFTASITSRCECLIITIRTEDPIILRSEWHVYQGDLREGGWWGVNFPISIWYSHLAHIAEEALFVPVFVLVREVLQRSNWLLYSTSIDWLPSSRVTWEGEEAKLDGGEGRGK